VPREHHYLEELYAATGAWQPPVTDAGCAFLCGGSMLFAVPFLLTPFLVAGLV